MQEKTKSEVFRFGVFEVDAANGELRKQGMRIRLQEQPSQLLILLLQHDGEIVSRDEICRKLWPPDTFVDFDQGLGTALRKLRQALGDDADTPRYIETIPKHGFRFISPVERVSAKAPGVDGVRENEATINAASLHRGVRAVWWLVAFVTACVASFFLGRLLFSPTSAQVASVRSAILPPSNWSFEHSSFSVSPDGTRLAFVAAGPDGQDKLWIRALSSSNAQQIDGTDGALLPFWSPDNRRVGFFAAGKLSIVDLESGSVRILCEAPFGRGGGTWNHDGTIVFSPSVIGPLYRIQDVGGVPVAVTSIRFGLRHMWPSFLPDGKHFLYSESSGPIDPHGNSIYLGSLDGGTPKLIISKTSGNVAYSSGYLLFGRDHTLWSQPFDLSHLQLSGSAKAITSQEVDEEFSFTHAEYSVSQTGVLLFQSLADSSARLSWFDARGSELGQLGETGYRDPRLSPDGKYVAVSSDDERNGKYFVRVYDLVRGISVRITNDGSDRSPAWTTDGKKITYSTLDALKQVPADGSGSPQVLLKGGAYLGHLDWSRDAHLVFTDLSAGAPALKIYSASDHQVAAFSAGAEARFSPDGKWVAYVGPLTAPDTAAIFVAPFPGPGERIRVSSGSGAQPIWSHDGKHLYYIAPDRKLMAVDFDPKKKSSSSPRVLFQTSIVAPNFSDTQYAVSPDGRFLINSFASKASSPLTLVIGWTAQLKTADR